MSKKIAANNLWIYRKKKGFSQKRVAFFLDHKTSSQLSHYERGAKYPNLINALKLEIIYQVPVSFLYGDLYKKLREDIRAREKKRTNYFQKNEFITNNSQDFAKNRFGSSPQLVGTRMAGLGFGQ